MEGVTGMMARLSHMQRVAVGAKRERQWDSGRFAPTLLLLRNRHAPNHGTGRYKTPDRYKERSRSHTPREVTHPCCRTAPPTPRVPRATHAALTVTR
jgi:hypothetical protein